MNNQNEVLEFKNKIRKKTAIANLLVILFLLFFAYFGYQNSNWLMSLVCLLSLPFVCYNLYKYFFKQEHREVLNKYHDQQKSLPKNERDGYIFSQIQYSQIKLGITLLLFTILTAIILKFFNLL